MDKREKLILQIMKECEADGEPVTREEAEEMADMEINSNRDCREYAKSLKTETKVRKPRTKVVDECKANIIQILAKALSDNGYQPTVTNADKYIDVGEYTINLVKHRPKK